jgi:hypothetical protein
MSTKLFVGCLGCEVVENNLPDRTADRPGGFARATLGPPDKLRQRSVRMLIGGRVRLAKSPCDLERARTGSRLK